MNIIFSDFDNTLHFKNDVEKTSVNLKALTEWKQAGNQFCIATGRSYKSITNEFPEIKDFCDYYVVDSGSVITDSSGNVLHAFYFDPKLVADIIDYSKTLPEIPIPFYYTPNSENTEYKTDNVTKIRLWFKNLELMSRVTPQIIKQFRTFAIDISAKSKYAIELEGKIGFIEITPPSSSKGNAIKALCQIKNISPENVLTIGDDLNDYEMVRDFNGYAIENARLAETYKELNTISSLAQLITTKI